MVKSNRRPRLAFVVSHPIQYYAPLHQRLARRDDLQIKVFFTWHGAAAPVFDAGFRQQVQWDLPLTEGYDHEAVPNVSRRPGTSSFWGLCNPGLVPAVRAWQPDAVHITGWAGWSHLDAIRHLSRAGIAVLFRGDSHLLDGPGPWWRERAKHALLRRVYRWPRLFLCTGLANRDYYRAFGVPDARLRDCPHSVDVSRFAEPHDALEARAQAWRAELGFEPQDQIVLFAGKFEARKRPLELMRAVLERSPHSLLMVGSGALERDVRALAERHPSRCRVLPFQNQRDMPAVYRLGDVFVLPSSHGETWGLAVNEALASSRPVVMSDRVGCAADVARSPSCAVFAWQDLSAMISAVDGMLARDSAPRVRQHAIEHAWQFDLSRTEEALVTAFGSLSNDR